MGSKSAVLWLYTVPNTTSPREQASQFVYDRYGHPVHWDLCGTTLTVWQDGKTVVRANNVHAVRTTEDYEEPTNE